MKFVTVGELRGRTSELWEELERQRELSGLQRGAARRGLDRLTMGEVDKEVQAFRKGRNAG